MHQNRNSSMIVMQYSKNVIFIIDFYSVSKHNILKILPANIEGNHKFGRYWNATAAIQRISRAAHTARLIVSIVILP